MIIIEAKYERNDHGEGGVHGYVDVSVGSYAVARIPCRYNSRDFEDYPRESAEEVVAKWLSANLTAMPEDV